MRRYRQYVSLDDKQITQLDQLTEKLGVNRAALISIAISDYIRKNQELLKD